MMPQYEGSNFLKVFAYKLGFLLCVETLSKAGIANIAWPFLNAAILGLLVKYASFQVHEYPVWLAISIQALLLFMWAFKSTTKKLLAQVGEALKLYAGRK